MQDGLLGTIEVRLKDVHTIKAAGGRLSTTSPHPLSPDRLGFVSEAGSISFADLEPLGAVAVSRAVLGIVGPRLVDEFVGRIAAGQTVSFGPRLRATAEGLIDTAGSSWRPDDPKVARPILRWGEIERVDTTPAGVRVFALDRPDLTLTVPTWTENAVLLEALVKRQQTEPPQARGDVDVAGWECEHAVGGAIVCGVERASPLPWVIFGLALFAGLGAALLLDATAIAAVAAVVTFFGSVTAGTTVVMQRRRAFAVYERGVADSGGFVAFTDVAHVKRAIVDQYANGGYVGRSVTLVLTDKHGRRVRLSGSGDRIEGIAAAALRRALPPLVARARRTVARGGSVKAGGLVVDEQGLKKKKVRVPWEEIETAVVEGGCLHIWAKGVDQSVFALPLDQPDALVVMELIGERLDQQKSSGAYRDLFVSEPVLVEVDAPVRR